MSFERPIDISESVEQEYSAAIPESGYWDVFAAAAESSYMDSTVMAKARITAMDDTAEGGELKDRKFIYDKYKIKTDEPMTEKEAHFILDIRKEEDRRNRIIANSSGILKGIVVPFIGGMVGAMADPVDFTIGAALGGVAGVVGKSMEVTKAYKAGMTTAQIMKKGVPVNNLMRFGIAAVENMTANAITESLVVEASAAELKEYTAQQAFKNVVLVSLGMTGFIHGIKGAGRALGRLGDSHITAAHNLAQQAEEAGLNTTKVINMLARRAAKKLELDDNVTRAFRERFGDRAEAMLEKSDDLKGLVKELNEGNARGDVELEEIKAFKELAEEYGVEPERWTVAERDSSVKFSDDEITEMMREMKSDEFKQGYDPDGLADELEEMRVELDDTDLSNVEDIRKRITEDPESKDLATYKQDADEIEYNDESLRVLDDYIKCIGA